MVVTGLTAPVTYVLLVIHCPVIPMASSLDAGWNGIFISAFFQGVLKQDWWPGAESDAFWGMYNRPYNKLPKSHLDKMWNEIDNPQAYFPRLRGYIAQGSGRSLNVTQTRYLQNVAYIRLKNIQVGYNIPSQLVQKNKNEQCPHLCIG